MRNLGQHRIAWCSLLALTICSAALAKPSVDDGIAQYAAICGINLLAKDIEDEHGRLLLRFAVALRPTSNTTLLAAGMLEKGLTPDPIATKMTAARLYSAMAARGHWLRANRWSRNNKAGRLALLYYRMAERFRPDDEKIMLGLMKLRLGGIEGDLEQALARTTTLTDVFRNPAEPPSRPEPELELIDHNIAKYAAIWGTNRVAADPDDENGLLLLQLAGCLTPRNDDLLLTLTLLERGRTPISANVLYLCQTSTTSASCVSSGLQPALGQSRPRPRSRSGAGCMDPQPAATGGRQN